jgi:hypothetical protein
MLRPYVVTYKKERRGHPRLSLFTVNGYLPTENCYRDTASLTTLPWAFIVMRA